MVAVAVDSKKELREFAKEKRKNIKNKKELEKIITTKLLQNEKVVNSHNILVYISTLSEVSTFDFINELLKLNKNVYAPRVTKENIKFYKLDSIKNLEKSKLGILEPTSQVEYIYSPGDVIIVPGLLFDMENNRLGYGGGYYDRFLEQKNFYKIGVCFSSCYIKKIKHENHDIKMDLVITEM